MVLAPDLHDIHALEREIERAEGNDQHLHQLFNNLGVAYTDARLFGEALDAHREEKQACARLLGKDPQKLTILVDMAIAYRRCGDATMRVKKLRNKDDRTISDKSHILSIANMQHVKGLQTAKRALSFNPNHTGALVEVQAATASVGLTAVELGIETKNAETLRLGACVTKAAALLAKKLPDCVNARKRQTMLVNAANNCALALNALKDHKKARNMFTAVAVHCKACGDDDNYVRAVANLVDARMKECDFDAAKKYAGMWAEKANQLSDTHEEATAQMSLGVILGKLCEYDAARKAFQEAVFLYMEEGLKNEASKALRVVEENIEADKRDGAKLSNLESKLLQMRESEDEDDYNAVDETKMRREAGDIAHTLRRYETCIEHLERFMYLIEVKAHVCAPVKLGLLPGHFGKTVANLADACWKCERFEDAVKWGREELLAYGDEKAGQAQAWCNLGNYLCDNGRIVDGIEGLNKSIELAKEAGEKEVEEAARINLDIEMEKLKEKENQTQPQPQPQLPTRDDSAVIIIPDDTPTPPRTTPGRNNNNSSNPRKRRREATGGTLQVEKRTEEILPRFSNAMREAQVEMDESPPVDDGDSAMRDDRQDSIVVCSNQTSELRMDTTRGDVSRGGMLTTTPSSGAFSVSRPQLAAAVATLTTTDGYGTKSGKSRALSSAVTGGRYKDVADAYKRLCKSKRNGRGINARDGLLDILRKIATKAMFEEEEILVDFSGTFIQDHELGLLLKAVGSLDHPHGVKLNLARNLRVSHVGYRSFLDDNGNIIRELDISASGIHPKALLHIAEAVGYGGLGKLVKLCVSKNSLGKQSDAAKAVARLIAASGSSETLEEIDLSLNRLPGTFLRRLVEQLQNENGAEKKASVKRLDFRLNNSRYPTAFLEGDDSMDYSECIEKLAEQLPHLSIIDVSACGASTDVRNSLHELSRQEFFQVHIAGVAPSSDAYEEESCI